MKHFAFILLMLTACDSNVHYTTAAPVTPVSEAPNQTQTSEVTP